MNLKKTVVVIDDEVDIGALIKKILERSGQFDVFVAYDGLEGRNLCLEHKPHLILLDMVMPKMTGDEVLDFLQDHEDTKHIPVVVMSGLGEEEQLMNIRRKDEAALDGQGKKIDNSILGDSACDNKENNALKIAKALGVEVYLSKPFSKIDLIKVIGKILAMTINEV